jgi:hypothetical protein
MSASTAPLPVLQNRDKVTAPDGGGLKAKKEHTRPSIKSTSCLTGGSFLYSQAARYTRRDPGQ